MAKLEDELPRAWQNWPSGGPIRVVTTRPLVLVRDPGGVVRAAFRESDGRVRLSTTADIKMQQMKQMVLRSRVDELEHELREHRHSAELAKVRIDGLEQRVSIDSACAGILGGLIVGAATSAAPVALYVVVPIAVIGAAAIGARAFFRARLAALPPKARIVPKAPQRALTQPKRDL